MYRTILSVVVLLATVSCTGQKQALAEGPAISTNAVCSADGAKNLISRSAGGLLADTDPTKPMEERLASIKDANLHGDQCRAVLGAIPVVDCQEAAILPVRVNGKYMTYENGKFFEDGKPTTWKPEDGCDNPGMIGLMFAPFGPGNPKEGCLPNARLGGKKNGNVSWAWVCHNLRGYHEKTDKYDFVTLIGSNDETGETCFFGHDFQLKEERKVHGLNVIPPGGLHPHSESERKAASEFWEPTNTFGCMGCHGLNHPWKVTPHTNQSVVGGDGTMDIIPNIPNSKKRKPQWGFRIIGTVHNNVLPDPGQWWGSRPKAIFPKNDDGSEDRTCTKCHVLSDQLSVLRMARFATGLGELPQYKEKSEGFLIPPKAWMPPGGHADLNDEKKAQDAVRRYERAFFDEKWRVKTEEILTPCPAPANLPVEKISSNKYGVRWEYANDYGAVPTRDDVRFEITVKGSDGGSCTTKDIAPDSLGSTSWHFTHPKSAGVTYTYEIRPYRYCFELVDTKYSSAATIFSAK